MSHPGGIDQSRGWTPSRGIPPAARGKKDTREGLGEASNRSAQAKAKGQLSPRSAANSGGNRMRGGGQREPTKREEMQRQRTWRHQHGNFKTEAEREFQDPGNFPPTEDEYGRPVRRLFSGRIKKRVDLKHEGESDEVIYQYTGEGSPTPNKYALDEIYPEKFDDAAGQPSKTLFAKNARMRMVEYFPEKDIKAYLGGEADELMFGHSVSGYGMANDKYEVREVPDLIPQQYMSAAGLTSKELKRDVLKEAINQDGPATRPHVADRADEVMYGRRTNNHPNRRSKITSLPNHGFAAGYKEAAGMSSAETATSGIEPLAVKMESTIKKETPPYLGGAADEVIYGRQMGGNRSELNEIRDLNPRKFEGAAGLTSQEVLKANPTLEQFIVEQEPGTLDKIDLRRGGEMAERLGTVSGELGQPLRVASSYANEGPVPGSESPFLGAAGMNSNDLTTKGGSADQMIFRVNPQSGLATGGEAAQAMYSGDIGDSHIHKGEFEISSIYPRAYKGVAGASSRNLFKNSPEAGGRHLFSENLKNRIIGMPGCGTDAKPIWRDGSAGLNSRQLFKGHKLQAIGDTPRQYDNDKDGDGIADHLRDEEADLVLYGADLPDSELRKVGGIKDKNPLAFEGAAGLTSREVFRASEVTLGSADPDSIRLGQARWAGDLTQMLSDKKVEAEVQNLAPDLYKDAAGLTSKVNQQIHDEGGNLDDARGKRTMPPTQRAYGNPNQHTRVDIQDFDPSSYADAAGLTSVSAHRHEDEERDEKMIGSRVNDHRHGHEAGAVVFGGKVIPEKPKAKSIAGVTSGQAYRIKKSGQEARRLDVRSMKDGGGSESHDTMYGKLPEDVEYDGNEEPRIHEIPEMYPESFQGAAGLASKEVFRQKSAPYMFGEKTADGLEYGAKHIGDLYAPPNAAQLNQAFMQSSHWFEPEQEDGSGRPPTQEEYEQAMAANEMIEESRRHALYQSYASYGSEHPPESYGAEETGDDYYEGGFANDLSGEQHGDARMDSIGRQESPPKWASQPRPGASPPLRNAPPSQQQYEQENATGYSSSSGGGGGGPPMPDVPPERTPGVAPGSPMDRAPTQKRSAKGGPPPISPLDSNRSGRGASTFSPSLFEKGSFAARKIQDVGFGGGDGPLSGRGSNRSGGASMGAYADFAARMRGADSNRSQRSARSYRG